MRPSRSLRHSRRAALLAPLVVALTAPADASAQRRAPAPPAAAGVPAAPAASADQYVVSDGVWLRYRVIGRGEPLLMLNTAPPNGDPLLPLARALGTTRRVILMDARGFGTSGRPLDARQYGLAFVDDAVLLLDALHLTRVDVLGHGTGALIAAKLAATHPDRMRRLVLVGGPVYHDPARLGRALAPTLASLAASLPRRPDATRTATDPLGGTRPRADTATRAMSAAALDHDERQALLAVLQSLPSLAVSERDAARLRIPALGAAGGRDSYADAARELTAWWPGASSFVADGASHDGVLADAGFVARVRAFLEGR